MDEIDLRILEILEKNGRMSHEEIAKRLNLSRPAIHQRVARLQNDGIIKGYTTEINWMKAGQSIRAFIFVNVRTTDFRGIMDKIAKLKIEGLTIEECSRITGQWCIMLKIRAKMTEQLTMLHDEMLKIEGMLETFTMIVLQDVNKFSNDGGLL
jgi:Lrp/AsnC family leucine-responsive transcriptional regulator